MAFIQKGVVKGHLLGSVELRNIFYAQVDPTGFDTFQSLWEEWITAIFTPILAFFSTSWSIDSVEIYEQSGGVWVRMDEVPIPLVGTNPSEPVANLVAAVLIGKIVGKRAFGRKFLSGMGESAILGNGIAAVMLTGLAASLAAWITPIIRPTGGQIGGGIITKDGAFHSFSTGFVSSLLGTMRRRKPGLGI